MARILWRSNPLPATGNHVYLICKMEQSPGVVSGDNFYPNGTGIPCRYGMKPVVTRVPGPPLYAGSSFRLRRRIQAHSRQDWFRGHLLVSWFPIPDHEKDPRASMLAAERWLISVLRPAQNQAIPKNKGSSWHLIDIEGHWRGDESLIVTDEPAEEVRICPAECCDECNCPCDCSHHCDACPHACPTCGEEEPGCPWHPEKTYLSRNTEDNAAA